MPKIIENLPQKLLEETRREVLEVGYAALNIRTVAKNCGVGVGTVYNYYPSKDALIAGFLLQDWKESLCRIQTAAEGAISIEPVLEAIYGEVGEFHQRYLPLFHAAQADVPAPPIQYHAKLRGQLSVVLCPFCSDGFTADFLSEAILVWAVAGIPYETLRPLLLGSFAAQSALK